YCSKDLVKTDSSNDDCSFNLHLMVMICCNRFTSLSSYINYIILICEKSGKGKGKKEAPQVLERGFPPITKVTGFQPIYLSMNQFF
ncbi:hypothetical protein, partial [uncultured Ligilactobacillus sp.]|uniref:hypothetical protein n=1 Tax=uncultured Ligilactobacillus sp. TaxID=2837633 RepID=UPI00258B2040